MTNEGSRALHPLSTDMSKRWKKIERRLKQTVPLGIMVIQNRHSSSMPKTPTSDRSKGRMSKKKLSDNSDHVLEAKFYLHNWSIPRLQWCGTCLKQLHPWPGPSDSRSSGGAASITETDGDLRWDRSTSSMIPIGHWITITLENYIYI